MTIALLMRQTVDAAEQRIPITG
jgi:hypothetical protein